MSQHEIDKLTDSEWAMYWQDLQWLRKREKEESLRGFKNLGLM